eukprot:CAMPEP_0201483564 /NCGR_PEP_ID=MMETSP0151_2-20130828/7760_1 /ASSEMBLY_ACC=CAM_ASM_000257 /TAXON_ID=200890 /ORGANISM="Paramoeba atlantica, Strain 621/1 / CCAP 1560/9" /LENGTH=262 /DNA_ID=CAMNT_0047866757 /DNA_START=22 /DNA_END=807 /DNA_ORIENTATION=-
MPPKKKKRQSEKETSSKRRKKEKEKEEDKGKEEEEEEVEEEEENKGKEEKEETEAADDEENKSPGEKYFSLLDKKSKELDAVGSMLVCGIQKEEEDDDEEEGAGKEEDAIKHLTEAEASKLRHLIVTKNREKEIEKGLKFASNGQHGGFFCMFNTSDGNAVISGIAGQLRRVQRIKTLPQQFDALLGLTVGLKEYECWANDNEYWGEGDLLEKSVKSLGNAWKKLLQNDNEAMGIDEQFTRPALESFLEQFREMLANSEPVE